MVKLLKLVKNSLMAFLRKRKNSWVDSKYSYNQYLKDVYNESDKIKGVRSNDKLYNDGDI